MLITSCDGGLVNPQCSAHSHARSAAVSAREPVLTLARLGLNLDVHDLAVLDDNDGALEARAAERGHVPAEAERVGELGLRVGGCGLAEHHLISSRSKPLPLFSTKSLGSAPGSMREAWRGMASARPQHGLVLLVLLVPSGLGYSLNSTPSPPRSFFHAFMTNWSFTLTT